VKQKWQGCTDEMGLSENCMEADGRLEASGRRCQCCFMVGGYMVAALAIWWFDMKWSSGRIQAVRGGWNC